MAGRKPDTPPPADKLPPGTDIGPIYFGELNELLIGSGQFVVTEDILLNRDGSAQIVRRTEPCVLSIPQVTYEAYMQRLKACVPGVRFSQPAFEAGHKFVPTHLMSCSAHTLDDQPLATKEQPVFGTSEVRVALPIEARFEDGRAQLLLPGYIIRVEMSQLARNLGGTWFLQWSHGALGQTKLTVRLSVPNLRRGVWRKCIYNQFFAAVPADYASTIPHPYRQWLARAASYVVSRTLGVVQAAWSKTTTNGPKSAAEKEHSAAVIGWPTLGPGRLVYAWQESMRAPTTLSIHVAYGRRYRKHLFSPLGFLLSTIATIILTVLLADPLADAIKWVCELLAR